jgi:hypothetical protein
MDYLAMAQVSEYAMLLMAWEATDLVPVHDNVDLVEAIKAILTTVTTREDEGA